MPSFLRLLALLACILGLPAAELTLTPRQAGAHDLILANAGNGEWEVRTTGTDPYLFVRTDGATIDLMHTPMLAFDYFSTTGFGRMLVFVGDQLDIPHLITQEGFGRREGWAPSTIDLTATPAKPVRPVTSLRLTFGQQPGLVVRLRGLRARAATAQELRLQQGREERLERDRQHEIRLRRYLDTAFPATITSVAVDQRTVQIAGTVGTGTGRFTLAEVPIWADATDLRTPASQQPITPGVDGTFRCTIERMAPDGADRLLSGWAVARSVEGRIETVSAVHHPDRVTPRAELPPAKPRSLKGLGGCPFGHQDMTDLGIASVTLNIILNDIIHTTPGPKRVPHIHQGRTWHLDEGALAHYDREMLIAAQQGWMVSAIVLLPQAGSAPADAWIRAAGHPEADPGGAFVMPNLTAREGVAAFAAAMDAVAERYSRPDGRYGRIHHWIMHNEINSGFYWTTAGTRTLTTYLDLYQRSMRIAWLMARQYDPNAKPLISLDHCWMALPDIRGYRGRDLLELLARFSRIEGDYPWGVAFHPYPQDIANPRTWEDREATFAFDTPFLTFRNLEVLDAWCRLPRTMYRGSEPREVQLTEQGLNTPDYRPQTLADQAAGLAYAWTKIEGLSTITAFQYHLWTDDHGEGGLRLGLRKFADDPQDPHGRKPAWDLFRAMGTVDWDKANAFAKPILGITNWNAVRHQGTIR